MAPQLQLDLADALYETPDRRAKAADVFAEVARQFPTHEVAPYAAYMSTLSAMQAGQPREALRRAKSFATVHAHDDLLPDVWAIGAEAHLKLGEVTDARKAWEQLLSRYPNRPERSAWISRVALCFNRQDQPAGVIKWLTPRLADLQDQAARAESEFLLGAAYLDQQQPRLAISHLQASLKAESQGMHADHALLLLAEAQQARDDLATAATTIDQLVSDFPQSSLLDQALYRRAEIDFARGDFAEAARSYRQVIECSPESNLAACARYGWGWSTINGGKPDQAVEELQVLAERTDNRELAAEARYAPAVALQQQGEFQASIQNVEHFLRSAPAANQRRRAVRTRFGGSGSEALSRTPPKAFVKYWKQTWNIPTSIKSFTSWLGRFNRVTNLAGPPKRSRHLPARCPTANTRQKLTIAWANSTTTRRNMNRPKKHFGERLNAGGEDAAIRETATHKLAWSQFQQNEFAKAARSFERQLSTFPQGDLAGTAHLMVAECSFQQEQYEPALRGFQQALTRTLADNRLTALGLLHAGQAANQLKQWPAAVPFFQRLVKTYPSSPYLHEARYEQACGAATSRTTASSTNDL